MAKRKPSLRVQKTQGVNKMRRNQAKEWERQLGSNTAKALDEAIKIAAHNKRIDTQKMDNSNNRLGNLKEIRSAHRANKRRKK